MIIDPLLTAPPDAACRVCHCATSSFDDANPLLSPCLCDGSVRWIHRRCLDVWRLQGAQRALRTVHCELCGFAYLYEVKRISRLEPIQTLLFRSVAFASVIGGIAAIAFYATSSQVGLCAGASLLGPAALIECLPLTCGGRTIRSAVRKLAASGRAPTGVAEAQAESRAQARAADHSDSAASAIARMRARHEMELPSVDDLASGDSENAEAGASAGIVASGNGAEIQGPASQHSGSHARRHAARARWGKCRCIAVVPVALLLIGGYIWCACGLLQSSSGTWLVGGVTTFGAIYWLGALGLLLAVEVCGPVSFEPCRGQNGFYLIRNITLDERDAIARQRIDQSPGRTT